MTSHLLALLLAPLALQAAAQTAPEKPTSFAQIPIIEATAPRCAIAFAKVEEWQSAGDARGNSWPNMAEAGGREFFVIAMARLMDAYGLERADLLRLLSGEIERHDADNGAAIEAMMPACLTLLSASAQTGE